MVYDDDPGPFGVRPRTPPCGTPHTKDTQQRESVGVGDAAGVFIPVHDNEEKQV